MATTPTSRQDGQLMRLAYYSDDEDETTVYKRGWLPFTILPHLNGQKYTIGDCMDPDEQGEYIFLDYRPLYTWDYDWKGPALCQILCLEGKYWVRPLGGNSLFINNIEIESAGPGRDTMTELQFGDYLHFEPVVERGWFQWGNENRVGRFWFKERGFVSDWEAPSGMKKWQPKTKPKPVLEKVNPRERESQRESNNSDYEWTVVMNNTRLMSRILSYLPLKDLKNTALVSHFWNQETNHALQKRSVFLNLVPSRLFTNNGIRDSLFLFRFWDEMRNMTNCLHAWNILIPYFASWNTPQFAHHKSEQSRGKKWISDMERILSCGQGQGHALQKLILDGSHKTELSFEMLMKILHQFQSTLRDLTLGCGTDDKVPKYFPFPETLTFDRLERFAYKDENDETKTNIQFVVGLVKAISGIRSLSLTCGRLAGWIFLDKLQTFTNLEELSVKKRKRWPECLSKLENQSSYCAELVEMTPSGTADVLLYYKQTPNIMSHLDLLQNLRNPLTKLELLECLKVEGQGDVTAFQDLLHKQANTLKVLRMFVPYSVNTEVVIQFPVFPNLTHLAVIWTYDPFTRAGIKTPATLTFGDLSKKGIQYSRDVPALQCLTLEGHRGYAEFIANDDEGNDDISETFFPGPCQIVKTLQKLEMCHSTDGTQPGTYDLKCFKPDPDLALKLSEMFPNVHNEWMNETRNKSTSQITK